MTKNPKPERKKQKRKNIKNKKALDVIFKPTTMKEIMKKEGL